MAALRDPSASATERVQPTTTSSRGDEHAARILRNCACAMREGGKILVVEMVLPSRGGRDRPAHAKWCQSLQGRHRGFILQPTYRVEAGKPVVHIYGVLEGGRPFLVRDRRLVPRFYVEARDAKAARRLGALSQHATERVTLTGQPIVAIEVATPNDIPPLRDL